MSYSYSVIEQLLQFLIRIIDTELFKAVKMEDLKTSNVQNANETGSLSLGPIQRSIDSADNPLEKSLIKSFGNGFHSKFDLLLGLSLGDVISAHFNPGSQERLCQLIDINAQEMRDLLSHGVVG